MISLLLCLSVCLSVCPLACLRNFIKLCALTRSCPGGAATLCTHVLWMTSSFHKMRPTARVVCIPKHRKDSVTSKTTARITTKIFLFSVAHQWRSIRPLRLPCYRDGTDYTAGLSEAAGVSGRRVLVRCDAESAAAASACMFVRTHSR